MVRHHHFDDHTGVCSRHGQFDFRPKGEWLFVAVGIRPPLNASLASPFGRGGGKADGEGESVTRPSQSPAVTALPEGEPRLQLFYGHPHDPGGTGDGTPRNPRAAAARSDVVEAQPSPQVCTGGSPSGEGAEPP